MNRTITSHCFLLGLLVLLLGGCRAKPASERTEEIFNLTNICYALANYADSHDGNTPEDLNELIHDSSSITAKTLYVKGDPHQKKWRYIGKTQFDSKSDKVLIESTKIYDGKKLVLRMNGAATAIPANR